MTSTVQTKPRPTGKIKPQLASDSWFLGQSVSFEIRDSGLRLVARTKTQDPLELPEGLYEVSAVLEDGRKHSEVVRVIGGQETLVQFTQEDESTIPPTSFDTAPDRPRTQRRSRFTKKMASMISDDLEIDVKREVDLVEM